MVSSVTSRQGVWGYFHDSHTMEPAPPALGVDSLQGGVCGPREGAEVQGDS